MALYLYNSLTNKLESFNKDLNEVVNIYVCGPTVYNYIHIGNARPIVFFDILVSYLRFLGYKVNYISNITDIDDKIIKRAISESKTEKEIASFYTDAYIKDVLRLNSKLPDVMPKATDHINDIIDIINKLVESGYAYNVSGNVYFNINKLKNYGILSNQDLNTLKTGVRIENNLEKLNSFDFTLWKKTEEGITFPSPYSNGRPGWHSECVVMSKKYANVLDIHGGGMDLKFPHHENEIAQAEALYNNTLARFWIHVGRVDLKGEKMSKSLGNSIFVKDFLDHTSLMTLRMILAFSNYRNLIDYSDDLYNQYLDIYLKFKRSLKQVKYYLFSYNYSSSCYLDEYVSKFKDFMDDDLNVQNVLTLLFDLFKLLNKEFREKEKNINLILKIYNTINLIFNIFHIDFALRDLNDYEKEIYLKWDSAKNNKDYDLADKYRVKLVDLDII